MPEAGTRTHHESFSSAIRTLLPYQTPFGTEPILECLSVHLDRYVETLSSATQTLFSI